MGDFPGQHYKNARLVARSHVSAAAPESIESGAARTSGAGQPGVRSGLASVPAPYASAACSSQA